MRDRTHRAKRRLLSDWRPAECRRLAGWPGAGTAALHLEKLARVAQRLKEERLAAVAVVGSIRGMVTAGLPVSLRDEWITFGVAEKLSEACSEAAAHAPAEARALAECELAVAKRLDVSYPRIIRAGTLARAWTDVATALRLGGDPHAALEALDRADEALRDERAVAYDRAVVDVARATTLHVLGRRAEALALLDAAVLLFRDFGDTGRAAECERLKIRGVLPGG